MYGDDLDIAIDLMVEDYGRAAYLRIIGPSLLLTAIAIDDDRLRRRVKQSMQDLMREDIH